MVPTKKTFNALIASIGKEGRVCAAPDLIVELLGYDPALSASPSAHAALMAACEKAGQRDLALALFEKMKAQVLSHVSEPAAGHNSLLCTFIYSNMNVLMMRKCPICAEHAAWCCNI